MRIAAVLFVLIIGGAIPTHAGAHHRPDPTDVVKLTNGDRLTGTVVERTRDTLILDHNVFGQITVPIESVCMVKTDRDDFPAESEDPEAEPLHIVPTTDHHPGVATADASATERPTDEHTDIIAATAPALEGAASGTGTGGEGDDADAEWSSQIELGLTATEGASETLRFRGSFRTARSSPTNIFRYDATYRLMTDRGKRSQNRLTTGAFSEWPFPETKWSTFLEGRYDYSEFQSWDHRLAGGGGFSYRMLNLQREGSGGDLYDYLQLKLRGGAGFRREFGSLMDEFDPEGIIGAETWWRINEIMRVEARSTAYPSLDRLREYRIISSADWTIDINELDGISLRLGVAHEYESQTDPSISNHDLSAYATLVIDF